MSTGGRTRLPRVGVLVGQLSSEYAETIVSELVDAGREFAVETICLVGGKVAPADLAAARHAVFDLATRESVDALLILPLSGQVGTNDVTAFCRRYGSLPICGIAIPWSAHPAVLIDNETGLRETMRHLIRTHGHRRIAFVRGPELNAEAERRYAVYREFLADFGIAFDSSLVAGGTFEYDGGVQAARQLLDTRQGAFDAVVCANDRSAFGVVDELRRLGIRVPGQVAVVGFDDIWMSYYIEPSLTTVRQPARQQARRALRIVLAAIQGEVASSGPSVFPATLVVRESCGCPPYVHPTTYARESRADTDGLEALWGKMAEAAETIRHVGVLGAPTTDWPEVLYTEFVAQVAGSRTSFLTVLGRALTAVANAVGEVGEFHRVITVLLDQSQRHLRGDPLELADKLLHAARVKVNGVAGRVPTRCRIAVEHANRVLQNTSGDLASVTDLTSLGERLAAGTASMALGGFHICRYEDGGDGGKDGAGAWARLVVAHDPAGMAQVPPGGVRFPSDRLLPEGFLASEAFGSCVVCPLDCGEGRRGYVVFKGWTGHGIVYEGLAQQIGHALGRIALLDRLVAEARDREVAEAQRLEGEMRIAREIHDGILPHDVHVEGLEIASVMLAASEVAGDYHDIIPTKNGCWIGIGDVSGHGLPAGLATLTIHSVVSGVSRCRPDAIPGDVFAVVNSVFYDNVRARLGQAQHATLNLLRYERSGRLVCAGAHEVTLVFRAEGGRVDVVETPGTWLGLVPEVRGLTPDTTIDLDDGDLVVLFTDGVTEARDARGEMFGLERLIAEVSRVRGEPALAVRDAILAAVHRWAVAQEDDLSLVVARHRGVSSAAT